MFKAIDSPYLVPFNRNFQYTDAPTKPPDGVKPKDELKTRLDKLTEELDRLQRVLYAQDRYALLLIFQAMDAAGKDSTIRAVMKGVDPTGCQVYSFKQPSSKEVDHDFLWRTVRCLPERGRIGIFNRSYYEEVLVVRVHPEYLERQRLPGQINQGGFWEQRYESIQDHEKHIARNGTVLLKFWLNVSKEEQAKRFLSRLEEPEKNWKFSPADVRERAHWHDYMKAYEEALDATSRPWAPWYAIPADNKAYLQVSVAEIIVKTLKSLDLKYPEVNNETRARCSEMRRLLRES
ncbi:MAG: polyphosphate kinase 2 family protein [Gammaproteobacteria bacterium]